MGPALGVRADAFQLEHKRRNDFFHPSSCSGQVAASSPSASIPLLLGAGCHFRAPSLLLLPFLAHNHDCIWFFPLFSTLSPAYIKLLKDCMISVVRCAVCQILHPFCCRHDPCEEPLDLSTWIYLGLKRRKTPLTSQFSSKGRAQN